MLVGEGVHDDLPFVDQLVNGKVERRYLTALPTPAGHKMMLAPGWEGATGLNVIPRAKWAALQFERVHKEIPILDQNGHGACVGYAATGIAELLRARAGMTYVPLSADFLYTLINGGRDMGANGGDAIQAMIETGIAPASLVPGRPIRPAGYSTEARSAATAFRLRKDGSIPLQSFDEVVTAVAMGWQILFDVQAGSRYTTTSDGTVTYLGRFTNHEQQAGEGLRLVNGQMQVLGRNSWNTVWGQSGFGWYTEQHFAASNSTFAVKYMASDPADPGNLPVFA